MCSNTPAKDSDMLPMYEPSLLPREGKRSGQDEYLDLPLPSKRERMDPSYYFQDEDEASASGGHEEAVDQGVDFAMELLQQEHDQHDSKGPSLEFSVVPHRGSIGLRSSEFVSQICATVKASELPTGDFARAPVDIVVALDVSGSMVRSNVTLYYN